MEAGRDGGEWLSEQTGEGLLQTPFRLLYLLFRQGGWVIGGIGTKGNPLGLVISNIIIKSFGTQYIIDNIYINVSSQDTLISIEYVHNIFMMACGDTYSQHSQYLI